MKARVYKSPPGPKGHWLLGSLPEFRKDMLAFFRKVAADFGDIASYRLGPRRLILISDPALVEKMLVTDHKKYIKPYVQRLLRPIVGNGLFTSDGEFWSRQRRLVQPSFNRQHMESYAGIMALHTQRLLEGWRDGEEKDLHAEMMRLTLGTVSEAMLNVDAGSYSKQVARFIDVFVDYFERRLIGSASLPYIFPTPENLKMRRAVRGLEFILDEMISSRRKDPIGTDLLSVLMRARDESDSTGMTDRQLRDEALTVFLAGHETTTNALSWTWYLLASHPDVEEKLLSELREVLNGRSPTLADIPMLKYTEQVLLESMRLFPPIYALGRETVETVELGGYEIPPQTTVIASQWVMHYDSRYFDDPTRFNPDRFSRQSAKEIPKYAYFPFGGGPRYCVGKTFGMVEAALAVATLAPLYRFELNKDKPVYPRASVMLRPATGVHCTLRARKTRVP